MEDLVSIIMPVYNVNLEYLKMSIDSILEQTYQNFEFIIIDDSSDSFCSNYLTTLDDPRIKYHRNSVNLGVTKSLNIGIELSKGNYIIRMDADDYSFPNRLSSQIKYISKNTATAVCGSIVRDLESNKIIYKYITHNMDELKVLMLFGNYGVPHPTAIIDRKFIVDNQIKYDDRFTSSQDYKFWIDILLKDGAIILKNKAILKYRKHQNQITSSGKNSQILNKHVIMRSINY
nr:glycosyltransferase [Acholeplasma laidlawii]